jgi:hypothetical protein
VGEVLERYPELEDVLIGMAPPFKKLKNPFLRKSVGKVATLRQAAAVGRMSATVLVNRLRIEVGQAPLALDEAEGGAVYFSDRPEWFDISRVAASIDETRASDPNEMTLASVTRAMSRLEAGEILELITTFLPAPGIDVMRKKGFLVWPLEEGPGLVKTYFLKP